MAKLTNKQYEQLAQIKYHLNRASRYLLNDSTAVAHRSDRSTTTLDYVRALDGKVLYEVQKEYGSDLCGIWDAIKKLDLFMNGPKQETSYEGTTESTDQTNS